NRSAERYVGQDRKRATRKWAPRKGRTVVIQWGWDSGGVSDSADSANESPEAYLWACGLWAGLCLGAVSAPLATFTSKLIGNCLGGQQAALSQAWYFKFPCMAYLVGTTLWSGRTTTRTAKSPV